MEQRYRKKIIMVAILDEENIVLIEQPNDVLANILKFNPDLLLRLAKSQLDFKGDPKNLYYHVRSEQEKYSKVLWDLKPEKNESINTKLNRNIQKCIDLKRKLDNDTVFIEYLAKEIEKRTNIPILGVYL